MRVKLTHFERVAGLLVLSTLVGFIAVAVGSAVQQGLFDAKTYYTVRLSSADGIRPGSNVQMSGLRVGSVDSIRLGDSDEVFIRLKIAAKYRGRIREDSTVRVYRSFLIGEKIFEIVPSQNQTALVVAEGGDLKAERGFDILELASGKGLNDAMATLGRLTENLRFVAEAMSEPERVRQFIRLFDELTPLTQNLGSASREAKRLLNGLNQKERLIAALDDLKILTGELKVIAPILSKSFGENGQGVLDDFAKISRNMVVLTEELQKLTPLLGQAIPELPRAGGRALEALDETVVTLKALQRTFLLRSSVDEVKRQESDEEAMRKPANQRELPE